MNIFRPKPTSRLAISLVVQRAQHTVSLWIPNLNLKEALRDTVHLLNLDQYQRRVPSLGPYWRTVCSRPPIRESSKALERANGDTVAIVTDKW